MLTDGFILEEQSNKYTDGMRQSKVYIYIYISVHSRATQLPKLGSALIMWVAALNI